MAGSGPVYWIDKLKLSILFIYMLLLKGQVYRHLLFNSRLNATKTSPNYNILRLGFLIVLIEVYIKWFRQEKDYQLILPSSMFIVHFFYLITFAVIELVAFQWFVALAARVLLVASSSPVSAPASASLDLSLITAALIISSFGKLLVTLMVIWDYHEAYDAPSISVFVLASNVEALTALTKSSRQSCLVAILFGKTGLYLCQQLPYPLRL